MVMQALDRDGLCKDLGDGNLIAEKVFAGFRALYPPESGGERVEILAGSSSNSAGVAGMAGVAGVAGVEAGYKGLRVRRLPSELEELGIHDPDPDPEDEDEDDDGGGGGGGDGHGRVAQRDRGERRYSIRWETTFGELKGEFEQIVVLPPQQRGGRGFDELANFEPAGDGGGGSGGGGAGGSGGGGNEPAQSIDELHKRVEELEKKLRGKDRELVRFREGVLRAVVS